VLFLAGWLLPELPGAGQANSKKPTHLRGLFVLRRGKRIEACSPFTHQAKHGVTRQITALVAKHTRSMYSRRAHCMLTSA
jgi:hypothetical protein